MITLAISPAGAGTVADNTTNVNQTDTTTQGPYTYTTRILGRLVNLTATADAAHDYRFDHWEVTFEYANYSDDDYDRDPAFEPTYEERTFTYQDNPLVGELSASTGHHGLTVPPFDGRYEGSLAYRIDYSPAEGSATFRREYTVVRNVRITAIFARVHVDGVLTYHTSDGAAIYWTQDYFVGEPFALLASTPRPRQGWKFLGWSYLPQSDAATFKPAEIVTLNYPDVDLYAVWKAYTYLPIRNGAGTGLLRGANGLPLVDA